MRLGYSYSSQKNNCLLGAPYEILTEHCIKMKAFITTAGTWIMFLALRWK